jgi:hypothetical protein
MATVGESNSAAQETDVNNLGSKRERVKHSAIVPTLRVLAQSALTVTSYRAKDKLGCICLGAELHPSSPCLSFLQRSKCLVLRASSA